MIPHTLLYYADNTDTDVYIYDDTAMCSKHA